MHSLFKPFGFGNTQMKQNNLAEMADKLLKFSDNKSWHGVGFLPFEVHEVALPFLICRILL